MRLLQQPPEVLRQVPHARANPWLVRLHLLFPTLNASLNPHSRAPPHPRSPHGDGDCAPPGCDCGKNPCGFYLWNHSATEVVNGQTFQDWFVNSYMLNEVGRSPLVSGFFWDDHWSATGGFPDSSAGRIVNDTGMTPA